MEHELTPPAFIPPLRVRAGENLFDIATLDEALAFAQGNPHQKGDYDGLIRRLQGAHEDGDVIEAGNAFRWWAQANDILIEAH